MANPISQYGFTAVPRSQSKILDPVASNPPAKVSASEITLPSTDLAQKVYAYAKEHLIEQTFNHSMRVFYYGIFPHCFPKSSNTKTVIIPTHFAFSSMLCKRMKSTLYFFF